MVIAEVSPGLLPLLAAVPAAGGQKGACVGDEMTWKVHKARVHDDIGTRDLPHLDFTGPGPAPRLWQGPSRGFLSYSGVLRLLLMICSSSLSLVQDTLPLEYSF